MVDFNKKFHNTNKFRQAALTFQKTGKYCAYPNNTQEYFAYWDQETDRCLNGYTAEDGDWISGYNYFYLNYCPIQRIVNHITEKPDGTKIITRKRELDFPDFWDYDVYFFEGVNDAETVGKHMCVLKSRRKGFSYKAASMCCRNYYLIPGSKSYVYASNKQYLTEDGTLTKAWDYMDFIDKHTAWGKKRSVNTTMRKRAGFFSRDEYGNQIELGYKSEIIGVTLKDNPDVGHPYDEYVYTPTGKLCWEDVKVGTQLFHCNKDITTVKEVIELGDVDVYEFQLSDGRTVQSTLDHKWRIFRYRHKQKSWNGHNESREIRELVCTTKDILDMMKYKNYTNNPARIKLNLGVEFNEQKIPVDAYTLGLLIGDGCFKKTSKNGVAFTQLPEDMEDIKQYIPYGVIKCNTKRGIDWKILIPDAKNKISELGLSTTTAENKFVPDIYKYNSEEIRLAVLNGLLDTDGTISKDCGVIEFSSKSNTLAEDVCFLCRSLGINCKKSSKVINNNIYYRVYIYSRSKDFRLFKLARKNERLKLKNDSSFAESRRIWTKIVSAKYVGKKKSKCVHVDSNDEVYLINDFIETKNCRGKAAKLILFEEAGSFSELGAAWEIARPSVEVDSVAFGLMLCFGTGGDEDSNFETLRSMFYNPEGYNCIEFENIWDDIATKPCGFFCPQYTNMDIRDDDGNRIYMDEDGNTLRDKSISFLLEERRKIMENAKTAESIDRYVAEHCLDGDTWISTEDGVSKIKDNPKAWISGYKQLYKVTTDDGTTFNCTDNHLIYNGKEYKELKDYKIGDTIIHHNTEFCKDYQFIDVPGYIPATNTKIKIDEDWALFLGLFMGDGYFYGPSGVIGMIFDKKDQNSLEWTKQFFTKNFGEPNVSDIGKHNGGLDLRVSRKNSQYIFKALDLLKSSSNGSLMRNVHIPEYIMKSPKSVVANFLKGLFDSDGYSSKDGKHMGFGNKDEQLLKDMQFLLRGFDIHATITKRTAVNGNGYNYTENKLNIRICDIPKFREHIGFLSNRKNENIKNTEPSRKLKDPKYTTIISIEPYKEDYVWDIETESHHLSANGIWVHNCLTPSEACLEFKGNIFPKKELQQQLARIRVDKVLKNAKQVGDLVFDANNQLQWIQKKVGDIDRYPLNKDDDPTGSIVIWEHPNKDASKGLYIAGIDSYDFDQSTTTSLGSCFIYKRFQNFEEYSDVIVAEYTGRPASANDFYENVRKLLLYYNATAMYENQNKGIFVYLSNKGYDYLLADQPDILLDQVGLNSTKVNRKKGCHMNQQIKTWAFGLIKDWLNELDDKGVKNLNKIMSEPFLEELIKCTEDSNVDRIMAFCQVMIYRQQLMTLQTKEEKEETKKRALFDGPLFTDSWFNDYSNQSFNGIPIDDVPTFTFNRT